MIYHHYRIFFKIFPTTYWSLLAPNANQAAKRAKKSARFQFGKRAKLEVLKIERFYKDRERVLIGRY